VAREPGTARRRLSAMAPTDYPVSPMRPAERGAVIATMVRAFYDDPLFGFFITDPVHQTKGLARFMGAVVLDAAPFGDVWAARTHEGRIAAAAAWLPPGSYPRPPRRELMTLARSAPAIARAGRRAVTAVRLLQEVERVHHRVAEPHYYLALLGTDPLHQRRGAAAGALAPVIARCDEEGVHAYLETQREENLAYYARRSFEVADTIRLEGAPTVWTMMRAPR